MNCINAGILFYRYAYKNGFKCREYLMLRKNTKKGEIYEDPGGKYEPYDCSLLETATREACEELNWCINYNNIIQLPYVVKHNTRCRYAVFLIKYPLNYIPDFGEYENCGDFKIYRQVMFVDQHDLTYDNIHPRLRFLLKYINKKGYDVTSLKRRHYNQNRK